MRKRANVRRLAVAKGWRPVVAHAVRAWQAHVETQDFLNGSRTPALIGHFNHIAIILKRTVHLNGAYSLPDRWRPSIVQGGGKRRVVTLTNACCWPIVLKKSLAERAKAR
jgi:hypothetical protein